MTMSKSIYVRRNGGLTFWRAGRLGGSFYCARTRAPKAQTWRIDNPKGAYRPTLRRVRSVADLGPWIVGTLYGMCAAFGAMLAAVAMWH